MLLERGIEFFDGAGSEIDLVDRVDLSAGVKGAPENINGYRYCAGAVVPAEPWRKPTPEELNILCATRRPDFPGKWISVVKIPDEILIPFQQFREGSWSMRTLDDMNQYMDNQNLQSGLNTLMSYCASFTGAGNNLAEKTGIRANPPNLPTVTVNDADGCLIGLHLDSWYRSPLPERHLAPNRISINIGAEDRHLLYINLPLARMREWIYDNQTQEQSQTVGELLMPFILQFPHYPVVRLRVRPGEAYIAPTENMIHDGSTIGKRSFDIHISILGRFEPTSHQLDKVS